MTIRVGVISPVAITFDLGTDTIELGIFGHRELERLIFDIALAIDIALGQTPGHGFLFAGTSAFLTRPNAGVPSVP